MILRTRSGRMRDIKMPYPWSDTNRNKAYELGEPNYFPLNPCKRGHTDPRRVKDGCCKACNRESVKKWKKKSGYKIKPEYFVWWKQNNKHRFKVYEKGRSLDRKIWRSKRARYTIKLATPKWLTVEHKAEILDIYKMSRKMTKENDVVYEVDHIVPLRNKIVCGLHVPWNLRIVTRSQNRSKGNILEENA